MPIKHLILGGARSGKSAYAETTARKIALQHNKQLVYLATAQAHDDEMLKRIEKHKLKRSDNNWLLVEKSLNLAPELDRATSEQCILVDCLTLWLSNCLHHTCWESQKESFLVALKKCSADVIMVSNEVGTGIVPMGELSRRFVDESGALHQNLANLCHEVTLVVAGLPLTLKVINDPIGKTQL